MKIFKKKELFALIAPLLNQSPVIVEAGAFDGTDTKKLGAFWPQGRVHSFEPVPDIFELLTKNTEHLSNVIRHPLALHNQTGTAVFYVSEKPSRPEQPFQAGSLLRPTKRLEWSPIEYKKTITVATITLDEWAAQQGIARIDFLWLDVQGNVLPILQAAVEILKTVTVLYLEVEFIQAYENQYHYGDIKVWLEERGFVEIGKDFENTDKWFYGNVLFCRKEFVVQ